MKIYIVWAEKSDTFSEDGDCLVAICSTLEKAMLYIDMPNFNHYITEDEVDSDLSSRVVYGR